MIIIGITGTLGAGKGTVVEYLVKNKGFSHYSVHDFLAEELARRGLPASRDNFSALGDELRLAHNLSSYIVEQLYRKAKAAGGDAVIESLHSAGEVDFLRKQANFFLFAVDADLSLRYERIRLRRRETDNVSFDKFIADEELEMRSNDPYKQNISACMARADYTFINNGKRDVLYEQVELALKDIRLVP